jgi:release factor glutamine methyltransferase
MAAPTAEQAWTLGALLDWTAKHLAQKGAEFPRLDAEVLLAHAVGCKRIDLYGLRFGETATPDVRQAYRELIRKRLEGCPVAYLVGRKEFYGLELTVSPAVLIPRPDTEHAVMETLEAAKKLPAARIVDIGTGSGAIAIAVAKHAKDAHVTAVDVSPDALAVARANADKIGVADRVAFVQGDLFSGLSDARFDIIVSNPPYIAAEDMAGLPVGVRQYEPHLALNGGPGGFAVFDRLLADAPRHLAAGGQLILEIGSPQELAARDRITATGLFDLASTVHDYSGHPRVLRARLRGA